ncbi:MULTISPECIES: hypothetical protein [unclassified Nonomuraea]|uniref:hypothetical protein n=1 Tax=unclassified Nonomuraea TaxID=2593643 RepID=UPI0033DD7FB9
MTVGGSERGGEVALLEEALTTVLDDLGPELRDRYAFKVVETPEGMLYIGLRDGRYWNSGTPLSAQDREDALWSAAEGLQDCLMELCRVVWPECGRHRLGLHARGRADEVIWKCEGSRPPRGRTGRRVAPTGGPVMREARELEHQ